jgi:hypothetical protein
MVLTETFPTIGSMRISRVRLALICGQFLEDTIPLAMATVKSQRQKPVLKYVELC